MKNEEKKGEEMYSFSSSVMAKLVSGAGFGFTFG
jgi:hypothetical protein